MDRELELPARQRTAGHVAKIILIVSISAFFAAFLLTDPVNVLRSRSQFKEWYPQFGVNFASVAKNHCSSAYDIYLYGTRKNTTLDGINGTGETTLFVEPMIACLLNNSNEYIKYALGSAQVMLGLTPTIIALLGASSEEVCLLALVGRRRFLALLLAAASPSIYTNRAFEYRSPGEILHDRLDREHVDSTLKLRTRRLIVLAEYLLALGALTNVAVISWELGVKSISGVSPDTTLMPMLWSFLAIPAHILGVAIFSLKARRVEAPSVEYLGEDDMPKPRRGALKSLKLFVSDSVAWVEVSGTGFGKFCRNPAPTLRRWVIIYWDIILREFWLHPSQGPEETIHMEWFRESRLFIICAWCLSVLIILHIILGTIILSSTTFIGPRDALGILVRYVLSVVICRVILVYELAVMRVSYRKGLYTQSSQESNREHGALKIDSKLNGEREAVVRTVSDNDISLVETVSSRI